MTLEQCKFLLVSFSAWVCIFLVVAVTFSYVLSIVRSTIEIKWLKKVSKLSLTGAEAFKLLNEHRTNTGKVIGN